MLALLIASVLVDPLFLQLIVNTVSRGSIENGYRSFFSINMVTTVTALGAAVILVPIEGEWVPTIVTGSVLLFGMVLAVRKVCSVSLASATFAGALFFTYKGVVVHLIRTMFALFSVDIEPVGFPEGWLSDVDLPVAIRWFLDNGLWFEAHSGSSPR